VQILHNSVRYNCRVFCLDGKILLIRPKIDLADDGNYREARYFTSWKDAHCELKTHELSQRLRGVTGQTSVPFGVAMIRTLEATIAAEICEELWSANRYLHLYNTSYVCIYFSHFSVHMSLSVLQGQTSFPMDLVRTTA
jgi:predicted amidohydrolase